jgi:four helix bundle protein
VGELAAKHAETGRFEFQKWPVYRQSIEVVRASHQICARLPKQGVRSIADQLRRASESIPLNIAEGSARYTRADKVNFFRIARGSVFECAAIVDVLRTMDLDLDAELNSLEQNLVNIGKMMSGFIRYLENTRAATPLNP